MDRPPDARIHLPVLDPRASRATVEPRVVPGRRQAANLPLHAVEPAGRKPERRDTGRLGSRIHALPYLNEVLFPFRGNWNFPFILQRYLRTSRPGFTRRRLQNAALALAEMQLARPRVRSLPFVLRIEPTDVCNLRCPRCSCGISTDPRPKGVMALEDFRLPLEQNRDNAILVRLDGNGEPTLHPRIFDMISMAKSYGYSVSMSSNFTTKNCAKVEEFVRSGLDRLIVAIDGTTQESYGRYRVGGELALVEARLQELIEGRRRLRSATPFIEVQFLDWEYNHDEIPEMRRRVRRWGADKLEVVAPDWAVTKAKRDPLHPRRCYWLWTVLTLDWNLNYHSCTNAWTLPWPRLNLRNFGSREYWNHDLLVEARRYNKDKSSKVIADDPGCHCNNCSDMLVVDRPPGYVCE